VTTSVPNGFLSVVADDVVSGNGIRPETMVSATGATAIQLYNVASATVTGVTLTFSRPMYALASDCKAIFDVRLAGTPQPVIYKPRRTYDRTTSDQLSPGVACHYDLYYFGSTGKIRLLPPPSGTETGVIKYYRRITMPTALATGVGLDIPEDYEDVFLAAAKAHFLADKSQLHQNQWGYWNRYAEDGLKEIRKDERIVEDETLVVLPPMPEYAYNPNSTKDENGYY
jgi:hypothetical protein